MILAWASPFKNPPYGWMLTVFVLTVRCRGRRRNVLFLPRSISLSADLFHCGVKSTEPLHFSGKIEAWSQSNFLNRVVYSFNTTHVLS